MTHEQIQYVEFQSNDVAAVKYFYTTVFGWTFTDYGPEYTAFDGEHVSVGFCPGTPAKGSALVILYSNNLEETQKKVQDAEGKIVKEIFSFPGGRRFHFEDPDGNELAVWSDQ